MADKSSKAAKPKVDVDERQLKDDIKAFASQLGLSSSTPDGAWDGAFNDFAPSKAQKKIGRSSDREYKQQNIKKAFDKAGSKHQQHTEHKQDDREGPQPGWSKKDGKKGRQDRQQHNGHVKDMNQKGGNWDGQQWQQQEKRGWQEERSWQEPKGKGKSILPRDEPAIWYEAAATLPVLAPATKEADTAVIQSTRVAAERLLQSEEQAFEGDMGLRGGQDLRWLQQARRSGTTQDKVAAMSVLVQESSLANLRSLDGLIAMCSKSKGGRGVVGSAMDALRELFTMVLLPERKLKYFEQQPLEKVGSGKEMDRQLLYLYFEDCIKKRYGQFVDLLDACSRDNLEFVKDKAVKTMFDLLSKKPEAEQQLLSSLVNKLGDPDRKLASKVGYLLTRLLTEHPGMKGVVVREIERFVFRPGLTDRARYYCVVYLNQMVLSHRESQGGAALSRRLVDLYFTLFKMIMDGKIGTAASVAKHREEKEAEKRKGGKKKGGKEGKKGAKQTIPAQRAERTGELDARMLSALIAGVRRAFPYVSPDDVEPLIEAHADALFRLIHTRSFGVATQALLLLFQLMTARNSVSDRFYRALYSVLESPELTRSTKTPMFLSLLFKALKADVSHKRVSAFAKRVLQVAQEAPPNFSCGCLFLLSELMKERPALWNAVLQPEDNEQGEEHFRDAELAPAGKDGDVVQEAADVAGAQGVGSDEKRKNGQRNKAVVAQIDLGSDSGESDAAEEELQESDSEDREGEDVVSDEEQPQQRQLKPAQQQGQQHEQPAAAGVKQRQLPPSGWPSSKDSYDMRKREPQFSNAERSCFWELTTMASHVHPSVAAMARTLLAGANVVYSGDPLRDLTLGAFLDKFVQKKARASERGGSLMQPLSVVGAKGEVGGVPSATFAVLSERDISPDSLFFHKYYSLAGVQSKLAGKKRKKGGADMEELLSDESEEEDAIEDFLAGEEEGGEEGLGADPDRAADYDYADLAAAMDDDEPSDADSEDAGAESDSDAKGNGRESDSEAESLEGAEFSDMSGDEDDAKGDSSEEGDLEARSDSDLEAAARLDDDISNDDDDSLADSAAEDAEVAALLKERGITAAADSISEDSLDSQLNPFKLAEASSGEEEESGERDHRKGRKKREKKQQSRGAESAGRKQGRRGVARGDLEEGEGKEGGVRKKARKERGGPFGSGSAFASADDYAALIDRAEEEERGAGAGKKERRPKVGKKAVRQKRYA